MSKSLCLFLLCCCFGLAHAVPVEDEPLPFDTRMPPRTALPVTAPEQAAPREQAESTRQVRQKCRTVTRKVRGRRVKQQQCTEVRESAREKRRSEARQGKRSVRGKAVKRERHASTSKGRTAKKAAAKARKRR